MTWKEFKELMETNRVPDDAILRMGDPEVGGVADVIGIVYGPDREQGYTVEFFCDSEDACEQCDGALQTRVIGGERYQCCNTEGCAARGTPV